MAGITTVQRAINTVEHILRMVETNGASSLSNEELEIVVMFFEALPDMERLREVGSRCSGELQRRREWNG